MQEARCLLHCNVHGSRSMPEAIVYTTRKPDTAGDQLQGLTTARKPVSAGGLMVCTREARRSGRPGDKYIIRYMEAGLCRRPFCVRLGSPTLREAHYRDVHLHRSQSMPEASLYV